ncbi:hypothetical protein SUGI_0093750 [Cryptomeria japonica]|uniref:protein ULTRAPETALA 2-like n=1 Tax=Cryptomeria japonica TaxID=3369 RepID=UPI002408B0C5|nr:protein ULTRAPETALA 2-like [Cryptomeria japonica]GLJ08688.1 hypothetical protein SUGI_0093750 [Cryptomeria japonica]
MEAGNKLVNSKEFFSREDLKGLLGWKLQTGFLEITCGCTSTMGFGDFVGSLRITQQGELSVVCNCLPGACKKGPMPPIIFQKHAHNDHKTWKDSIWVTQIFQTSKYTVKVPLCNTVLLRYYYANRRVHHVNFHRDEFLRCSACGKERRFKLRSKQECGAYCCAVKNPNWVCADFVQSELNCEMEEERASRKVFRGCPKLINCEGCLSCVCTGCDLCMPA